MRKLLLAGAMLAAVALGAPGYAAVTLGTPLTSSGAVGAESDVNGSTVLAQNVQSTPALTGTYTIGSLTWWGNSLYGNGTPYGFHIKFYDGIAGGAPSETVKTDAATSAPLSFDPLVSIVPVPLPGEVVESSTAFVDSEGYEIFQYKWSPISTATLALSGPLFVSIAGDFGPVEDIFLWAAPGPDGVFYKHDNDPQAAWEKVDKPGDPAGPLAVTLTLDPVRPTGPSNVPEPASWALMVVGFGVIGAGLRRRRVRVAFA